MGSYDAPFAGCVGVLHMGAVMGRPGANKETPQEVYDGSFTDVAHVWDSAVKAGTVKRFVQASSNAVVRVFKSESRMCSQRSSYGPK